MNNLTKEISVMSCEDAPTAFEEQELTCYPLAMTQGPSICNEELCTVSYDHALVTWTTPDRRADTSIYIGENPSKLTKHTVNQNTTYHWVELYGLKPSTLYWYRVESRAAQGSLNSFTTLPRPEGKHLFSYALFSDTHIASTKTAQDINENYLGKLVDHGSTLLRQSILDSKRRNIDLAVFTGDLADVPNKEHYLELRDQILPYFGNTPYFLCIGNHDKYTKKKGIGERGFLDYVSGREKTFADFSFHNQQFVLLDSCRENDNWGYFSPAQLQWLKGVLKSADKPTYLFMHHPCNGPDTWFGVRNKLDFQRLIRPYDCVQGVFCGHIHRNKVTVNKTLTGTIPYVEIPATVQFPCAYAIVQVFEQGFVYNSYKVSRLDLSELSRSRFILKKRGNAILTWYGLGGLGDRCFSYSNGVLCRPARFELSVTVNQQNAANLYQQLQSTTGAGLAYGPGKNKLKIMLGSHHSHAAALKEYQEKYTQFNRQATIRQEGGREVYKDIRALNLP